MEGHALRSRKDFQLPGRDPDIQHLPPEVMRHRVIVLPDLDVTVRMRTGFFPFAVFEGGVRNGCHGYPLGLEPLSPGFSHASLDPVVVALCRLLGEGAQGRKRREKPLPQTVGKPSPEKIELAFDGIFVRRFARPRRYRHRHVMGAKGRIVGVQVRISLPGFLHRGRQVIRD